MFTSRTVVMPRRHAALLETCGRSRMDRGHSYPISRRALFHHGRRGNPRFTLVSDGNPLRRLLLGSKKNSLFTAVSPSRWIARHTRRGNRMFILAQARARVAQGSG